MRVHLEGFLWAVPTLFIGGSLLATVRTIDSWRLVSFITRFSLGASLAVTVASIWAADFMAGFSHFAAPLLFTMLITFLGWIIGSYASRYLQGEPAQQRFGIAFLATLASVTSVVVSNNLAITIIGWAGSSAGLHQLLTFYPDRPAAILVAHKKFLASRLAEICLILAAALLYFQWGTLDMAGIAAKIATDPVLPSTAAAAAVLIACAVLIKSAQLPLHGWLIQVMEAPTPVSALLHAGVVNLGGYVLIRLSPLISASTVAQTILVLVGSSTAGLAGLVMMTRVTIKVRLAWSTCSQMGFMMLECGLGMYDLALLHLLAHSLYKAYAFLSVGDVVRRTLASDVLRSADQTVPSAPMTGWVLGLGVAWAALIVCTRFWNEASNFPHIPWIAIAFLASGLATLLWPQSKWPLPATTGLIALFAASQLYVVWHALFSHLTEAPQKEPPTVLAIEALAVIVTLYLAQGVFSRPGKYHFADRLYRWVYSGFYLDERFTNLTFRLWPVSRVRAFGLNQTGKRS